MSDWKHITVFAGDYPMDKQAEGIAIQAAVAEGYCEKCGFLKKCSTDDSFRPPVFAWCFQKKKKILHEWESDRNGE